MVYRFFRRSEFSRVVALVAALFVLRPVFADPQLTTFAFSGDHPNAVAFDGSSIWVVTEGYAGGRNAVTKMRPSDGAVLGTFTMGSYLNGITFDGANLWVTDGCTGAYGSGSCGNRVFKLRATDGQVLGRFPVGGYPHDIVFDGANIWTANANSNTVTKLRASDGTVLGTYPAGSLPYGIIYDGVNVWVGNFNDNTITELRASDGTFLGTYPAWNSPAGLAFDGSNIWVADYGGAVSKLNISGNPFNPTPCVFTASPTSTVAIPASGGSTTFTVSASPIGCSSGSWTVAVSDPTWISASPASGATAATVTVRYTINTSLYPRYGAITIAGQSIGVSQAGMVQPIVLSGLSPNTVTAGGPTFYLIVNGTGFINGSTVEWNGTSLTTTYASATQLMANVPAGLIANPGVVAITVVNPGGSASNWVIFTINSPIVGGSLTITTTSLPAGVVGAAYSQQLSAIGGTPPYSNWVLNSGSLPPGLMLNASSGTISGVPSSATGSPYTFSVIVKDKAGTVSAAQSLSIAIGQPHALTIITSSPLPSGTVGVPYSQAFDATSGVTPYKGWTITAGNLPPGTTLATLGGFLTGLLSVRLRPQGPSRLPYK